MALTGCSQPQPPVPPPPPPPTSSEQGTDCPSPGVRITAGPSDAATGERAMPLDLINCGTGPFEVAGYPSLRVLDEDGQVLPITITNGASPMEDPGPQPIVIEPGEMARAVTYWRNTVGDGGPVALTGTALEVRARPGDEPQPVTSDGPIDLGSTGTLDVTAWEPYSG
ncbi:DUF4232 domain-containing protein [Actinoalloteichus hymeniacidonis]|nr:DUF4232 domain-containing protein [Actinoalloteichus hymeniacidonis]MBB5908472.1 hypothetical protein [Actinoalloteichus hymeniacidonis]